MDVEIVRVAEWEQYGWLRHGFSTRRSGVSTAYGAKDLNLGFTKEDARANVETNRLRFREAVFGDERVRLMTVKQVHGVAVQVVREAAEMDLIQTAGADGMVTDRVGVALGILTADCVPVLVADVRRRAVGAFHAGWRGTAAGIVGKGVEWMRAEYGSMGEDLVAAVGPSIGACCYEVGEEFRAHFAPGLLARREGGLRLDLWEANRLQLVEAGLAAAAVTVVGECTACAREAGGRKYFSYRAEHGSTGRAMGLIGLVSG